MGGTEVEDINLRPQPRIRDTQISKVQFVNFIVFHGSLKRFPERNEA